MASAKSPPLADAPAPAGKLATFLKRIWWFHSFFALAFGVGVMLFARAGLAFADKVLMGLIVSWLLMFVALRFVVGPANRRPEEGFARKGVRLATNYIIKQFYQQMFFFLVPLYASSATWTFSSMNFWLAPLLLACAVVSTMDLVFDNFIMERRWLASLMYGLAMFGVINVLVPLVFGLTHLTGLFVAAAATPLAVALLSFSVRSVVSAQGVILLTLATGLLLLLAAWGRHLVPPTPLALVELTVGVAEVGPAPCLPAPRRHLVVGEAQGLRCGALVTEPGGLKEGLVHTYLHDGHVVTSVQPVMRYCDGRDPIFVSEFVSDVALARGTWTCQVKTQGGQLVGSRSLSVEPRHQNPIHDVFFAP